MTLTAATTSFSAAVGEWALKMAAPAANTTAATARSSRCALSVGIVPSTSTARENWMTGVGGQRYR